MIEEKLAELRLPDYLPLLEKKQQLAEMLLQKEYGVIPPLDVQVEGKIAAEERDFCAGKCLLQTIELTLTLENGTFTFPCQLALPASEGKHPLFVLVNFRPEVPDKYLPSEEICDRGYAVFSVCYEDISADAQDVYTSGLGKLLRDAAAGQGIPDEQLPGKIAIWAWTVSRMLDWVLTRSEIDCDHTAVIGHSRLGKTALLAGMLDERFQCVISNDSGCSGAAITRGKTGEHIADIVHRFPYWFCTAYQAYAGKEEELPFEQDWLLASIAPRLLLVGSAAKDSWADPEHEYLGCVSASEAWKQRGLQGFVHPDRLPVPGDVFHEGKIGYHLREGKHYLGREDWNRYMDFLDAKGWKE